MKIRFAVFLFLMTSIAEARVFDMTKEKFGSYLLGTYSQNNLKDTPMAGESSATSYNDVYTGTGGGEFGVFWATPRAGFRFGVEVLKGTVDGDARSGSYRYYHYSNSIQVISPKVTAEIPLKTGKGYRVAMMGFFGGSALTGQTDYSQVAVGSVGTHTVNFKSATSTFGGGMYFEFLAFDTTTLLFEAGYRQMNFANVTYAKDVTTFNGTYSQGATVTNTDASNRAINMNGAYATVGFRFFIF